MAFFRPRALISHDVLKVIGTRDAALVNTVQVSPETNAVIATSSLLWKGRVAIPQHLPRNHDTLRVRATLVLFEEQRESVLDSALHIE